MSQRIFHLYRYQIIPNERIQEKLHLSESELSVDEVIQRKNEFFIEAFRQIALQSMLDEIDDTGRKLRIKEVYPLQETTHNQFYVFKVAACKTVTRETENFETMSEEDWPRVHVIVWNDDEQQVLALEHRTSAFNKTNILANLLAKRLNKVLYKHNLNVQIHPIFDKQSFWQLVEGHKVEQIEFKMVTPNMANISKALSDDLKALAKYSNSANTELTMNAPENGELNLSPKLPQLQDLVDYSSKGGGSIRVKYKGVRTKKDTANTHSSIITDEYTVEVSPISLLERIKNFFQNR
ncbi:hypothetical protein [Neisseria chenwenguii]|uniref:hypothetical protein n=1 Tax=Neisseria chenwenguii TaxID=1853278 RepID=UPI000F4F7F06|nr:hypothetical protein [Neisseria chenwenguii]ROV56971.1 hypothetical protein EGS38_02145 [Neisseria chenwenguii]